MIEIDKFCPFVLPYADGVPFQVARAAVIKSCVQFCTQSLVWQEDYPECIAHPGAFIEVPVPPCVKVVKIIRVSYNGRKLKGASRDELMSANTQDILVYRGEPRLFYQVSLNTVRLLPAPVKHGIISITAALSPTLDAQTVPTDLYERFWPAIANGALADIKQIQGQTYTDTQAALVYKELFAQGVREAKNEAARSFGRAAGKVPFQRIV